MIICTVFTSAGQILYKFGANNLSFSFFSILTNIPLIAGVACYGVGLIFLLLALRGGELTVLYPIIATSYVWVSLASPFFFSTDYMTQMKWGGVFIIILGVSLIGWGARK